MIFYYFIYIPMEYLNAHETNNQSHAVEGPPLSPEALKKQEEQIKIAQELRKQWYIPETWDTIEDQVADARWEIVDKWYPPPASLKDVTNVDPDKIIKNDSGHIVAIRSKKGTFLWWLQKSFGIYTPVTDLTHLWWAEQGEIIVGLWKGTLLMHADTWLDKYKEKMDEQFTGLEEAVHDIYNIWEIAITDEKMDIVATAWNSLQWLDKVGLVDKKPIKRVSLDRDGKIISYAYVEDKLTGEKSTTQDTLRSLDSLEWFSPSLLDWNKVYDSLTPEQQKNKKYVEIVHRLVDGFNEKMTRYNTLPPWVVLPDRAIKKQALDVALMDDQKFWIIVKWDTVLTTKVREDALSAWAGEVYTLYDHQTNKPLVDMWAEDMDDLLHHDMYDDMLGISPMSDISSIPQSIRYTTLSSSVSYQWLEENKDIEWTDVVPGRPQQYTNPEISSSHATLKNLIKHPEIHHDIILDYTAVSQQKRDLMRKKQWIFDLTIKAYWDSKKQNYYTVGKPHITPFIFQNIIISDISNTHTTIAQTSPKISLHNNTVYTFVHATKWESIHTLLWPNQGRIRLDYSGTIHKEKWIVYAHRDNNTHTYVDKQHHRVKVYDNIQIQKDVENKENIESNLISKNKQLKEFLDHQKGYSLHDLYPDFGTRSEGKQKSYQKYAKEFSDSLIILDNNWWWTDTEIVYDQTTGQYTLEYALDDTFGNNEYDKWLSMSAENLFHGSQINESYLKEQLGLQINKIIKQYFPIPDDVQAKDVEHAKWQVIFDQITTYPSKKYKKWEKTYCSAAAREIADGVFGLNIPRGDALDAVRSSPIDKENYVAKETVSSLSPLSQTHIGLMDVADKINIFNKYLSDGATVLDIWCYPHWDQASEQIKKYGRIVWHRFLAFYRPSLSQWYFLDPVAKPAEETPQPLDKMTLASYTFDTIQYYKNPKEVVW